MDSRPHHEAELVGGAPRAKTFARRWKRDPACSGVVLYLGLDRAYEHLAHHDFVFSKDPEEEFHHIYDKGEPAPDPTCYLAATTRTEPGVAPPGGEALYVLVHTPYLRPHHDWSKMFAPYRQVILDKLKRCAGMPDLEDPASSSNGTSPRKTSTTATASSTAPSTASPATARSTAPSSPATGPATLPGSTSPAAPPTPAPACRWC